MTNTSVRIPKTMSPKDAKQLVSATLAACKPEWMAGFWQELSGLAPTSQTMTKRATLAMSPSQLGVLGQLEAQSPGQSPLSAGELLSRIITWSKSQTNAQHGEKTILEPGKPSQIAVLASRSSRSGTAPYTAEKFLEQIVSQVGLSSRASQRLICASVEKSIETGGVTMVEAPTGSGKTLAYVCSVMAMAANAVHAQLEKGVRPSLNPVCHLIAVPSMVLIRQVEAEMAVFMTHCSDLIDPRVLPYIRPVFVRGKAQYVSEERLMTYLEQKEEQDDPFGTGVSADQFSIGANWLQEQKDNPTAPMAWQMESLARVLPEAVTAAACDASTAETDPGLMRYRSTIAAAGMATVAVCSHVMLCIDSRLKNSSRKNEAKRLDIDLNFAAYQAEKKAFEEAGPAKGEVFPKTYHWWVDEMLLASVEVGTFIFPPIRCLVVDEAHQLQSAMIAASSSSLSVYALSRDKTLTQAKQAQVKPLFHELQRMGKELAGTDGRIDLHQSPLAIRILESLLEVCKSVRGKRKTDTFIYAVRTIENALFMCKVEGYACQLDFSPIFKHPRLLVGPKRVDGFMVGLWSGVEASTCLSATFFLPKEGEMFSNDAFMRILMAIPPRMVRKSVAIKPEAWLTEPVTLHVPQLCDFSVKPRSNVETEEDSAQWLDALHTYLNEHTYPTAAGGVLVLCTSYETATGLYSRLVAAPGYEDRLVMVSRKNVPLDTLKNDFETAYYEGKKGIWFAVGQNAWTGMDLRDRKGSPKRDNMLTDLVIPRLPFAGSNSPVMREMAERLGKWISVSAMLLLFKQGLGRLIRSQGVAHNRRIFMVDPRVHMHSYGTSVKTLLKPYRKD